MAWPLSQDYNEAIQNPASSFADPELKAGQPVTNALGMPMPRSGNFADVYEYQGASGAKWAVKCFTREVPGLRERYSEISKHLGQARLPFTVDFQYLEQGVRIRGQWYPVLKMQWVEGFLLNEFVRNNLDKPALLDGLCQIWLRMARRLREARMAHADLQHGNVILVPGSTAKSLAVKLIDYDGMFVPALAQKKSGEVGHPAYQHPQRLKQGTYNAEVDRLPLLSVACALRCLATGGKALWERYDNGDNLLFREADLRAPAESALFKELWNLPDAAVHDLVGYLTVGLTGPLEQAPLLQEVAAEDGTKPLTPAQEQQVTAILGPGAKVKRVARPAASPTASRAIRKGQPQPEAAGTDWESLTGDEAAAPSLRRTRNKSAVSPLVLGIAAAGVLAVVGVGGLVFALTRGGGHTKSGPQGGTPLQVVQNTPKRPGTSNPGKGTTEKKPPDNINQQGPENPGPEPVKPKQVPEVKQNVPPEVVIAPAPGGPSPLDNLDPARIDPADRHQPFGKDLVAVLKGYPSEVFSVAFSPDGRHLACAGNDHQTLCLWDLTRADLTAFALPTDRGSNGVAFSPDGKRVAVGVHGGVRVWDIRPAAPRRLPKIELPASDYWWLAYSERLLAVGGNAELRLLDLTGPAPVVRPSLRGHNGNVGMVAFSADGNLLASGGDDQTVRVWNLTKDPPEEKARLSTAGIKANDGRIWSVAIARDGQTVAAGCGDFNGPGKVHVWDLRGPEARGRWVRQGHERGFANGLAFAPDGKTLVSSEGSYHGPDVFHAVWWRTGDGAMIKKWQLPERCATVAFAPDGRHIALGCHNHKVYILRLGEKRAAPAEEMAQEKYLANMQEFDAVTHPDYGFSKGKFADQEIMVAGVPSPHGLAMHPPDGGPARVKYRLDRRWKTFRADVGLNHTAPHNAASPVFFEILGNDRPLTQPTLIQEKGVTKQVRADVRGVEILELRVRCQGSNTDAHAVWLEPKVTMEEPAPMAAKGARAFEELLLVNLPTPGGPAHLALSSDGRYAACDLNKKCLVWDTVLKRQLTPVPLAADTTNGLTFSPDGKQLAVRDQSTPTVQVWDVVGGRKRFKVPDKGPLNCVAYSADSRYLFTGTGVVGLDDQNRVPPKYIACGFRVWDAATGKPLAQVESKKAPVGYLAPSADGKSVLVCHDDHAADVYDWKSARKLKTYRTPVPMGSPPNIQWGPDGPRMLYVSAFAPGQFTLADLRKDKDQGILEKPSGVAKVRRFAWSPDGHTVAFVPEQAPTEIYVLDLFTDKRVGPITGHTEEVRHLAVSRDGKAVLSADNSTVRLWLLAEAGKNTPMPAVSEKVLAAKFIGKYRVDHSGAGTGTSTWVMKADHRAFQNRREMGTWKVEGNQVRVTYHQAGYGTAVLRLANNNNWVGENTHADGRVFNWVMTRLGPAD